MRTSLTFLVFVALAGAAAPAVMAAPQHSSARATIAVGSSAFGRILFHGKGRALYAFTRDPNGRSVCTGACAAAWPPFLVNSRPKPGADVVGRLIGTTRRADGKLQVTYGGRALYYYVGDRRPGQVLCQNVREFGGLWLVVRPSGRLVR
jgi:predicted lipoprotein with Yx(FWY)xxD motif